MAELFRLYTKEDFVYTVLYPTDFAPNGVDMEVSRFEKILKIPGLNKTLLSKVQEKLTRMVLADEDEATINEVIESIRDDLDEPESEPVAVEPMGETGSTDSEMDTEMMGATGLQPGGVDDGE
jgi:hypothetical protein